MISFDQLLLLKPVPGVKGYAVSSDGTVWSGWRYGCTQRLDEHSIWRPLAPLDGKDGYPRVRIKFDGKRKTKTIHGIVLMTFRGPCPSGMEARHLDGNPKNANLSNLIWGTHADNMLDRQRHGTLNKGERHGQAKLTTADVIAIREEYAKGKISQPKLAVKFGVKKTVVGNIILRKRWQHVP